MKCNLRSIRSSIEHSQEATAVSSLLSSLWTARAPSSSRRRTELQRKRARGGKGRHKARKRPFVLLPVVADIDFLFDTARASQEKHNTVLRHCQSSGRGALLILQLSLKTRRPTNHPNLRPNNFINNVVTNHFYLTCNNELYKERKMSHPKEIINDSPISWTKMAFFDQNIYSVLVSHNGGFIRQRKTICHPSF